MWTKEGLSLGALWGDVDSGVNAGDIRPIPAALMNEWMSAVQELAWFRKRMLEAQRRVDAAREGMDDFVASFDVSLKHKLAEWLR